LPLAGELLELKQVLMPRQWFLKKLDPKGELSAGVAKEPYCPYGQRPHTVHTVDHTAKSLISPFSPYVAASCARKGLESKKNCPTEMSSSKIGWVFGSSEALFHPHQQTMLFSK
jgi:hypothetical protein